MKKSKFCNSSRSPVQAGLWTFGHLGIWVVDKWIEGTDLGDAWVGALDVSGGEVEPAAGVGGDGSAVLPHGASALAAAPAALELPVRPQTHAAAVPLSAALVEVNWGVAQQELSVGTSNWSNLGTNLIALKLLLF